MKMVMKRIWLFGGATAVLALAAVAAGSVAERLSLAELVRRSDTIVVAQVLGTDTRWSEDHQHLYRRVSFEVEERWKGQGPDQIVLLLRGGELDGIQERALGVPFFDDGAREVLFLRRRGEVHTLVGMGQGAIELSVDAGGRQWGTQRLEELALAGPDARGVTKILEHGEGGLGVVPLDDLRKQVKTLGAAR
jgi:hypothetical protein